MKICGQKVTLPIHGRERTFSIQEIIAILEKHFSNEATEQATTAKTAQEATTAKAKVVQGPIENQWFEVNPKAIDQSLFQEERKDEKQERTRKLILEAFAEVKKYPERYGKKFKTMMPKKTWRFKCVIEIERLSYKLGDHIADWVEQALEWAQRICNGESWKNVCNDADTANWYRLILWKNGHYRIVGGSKKVFCGCGNSPASRVFNYDYFSERGSECFVPLLVSYDE